MATELGNSLFETGRHKHTYIFSWLFSGPVYKSCILFPNTPFGGEPHGNFNVCRLQSDAIGHVSGGMRFNQEKVNYW